MSAPWGWTPQTGWWYQLENSPQKLVHTHAPDTCHGDKCCALHNPTEHAYRSWEQTFDKSTGITYRIDPLDYSVWIVDPDCVDFIAKREQAREKALDDMMRKLSVYGQDRGPKQINPFLGLTES